MMARKPALLLVLISILLQLHFTKAPSPWGLSGTANQQTITSASELIQEVEQYFKDGLESLKEKSLCQHLKTVLKPLSSGGKIHVESNSEIPAQSLLDNAQFWGSASLQDDFLWTNNNGLDKDRAYLQNIRYQGSSRQSNANIQDEMITVTVKPNQQVSLPSVLFPGLNSNGLPVSQLLNMSFNCDTGEVDVHAQLSGALEVIPQVLSFSDVILSLRVNVGSNVTFDTLILSANTQIFGKSMFLAVMYEFSEKKFSFPPSLVMSVQQLIDHLSNLKQVTDSLPSTVSDILKSKVTGFNYNPSNKEISLSTTASEVSLVPNIVKLTDVRFSIEATVGSSPSLQSLSFSGTWIIGNGKVKISTNIVYNKAKNMLHVSAVPTGASTLSAEDLVHKITGNTYHAPKNIAMFTLKKIVGNLYNNSNYFIALQGEVAKGKVYVFFYKGARGLKAGVVASVSNFKLSDAIRGATGVDISTVPFFGTLVIPSLGLSIMSGEIKSPSLTHIFGPSSPLYSYGDTLPSGVTASFKLSIGKMKNITSGFTNGVISLEPPNGFSLQSLSGVIPGLEKSLDSLPSQLKSILTATIISFRLNTTSKELSVSASLQNLVIVPGFLSLSSVEVTYDGILRKPVTTRYFDFKGMWKIDEFSIQTTVTYDKSMKGLDISSMTTGEQKLTIGNLLEAIAKNDLTLPSAIDSFAFTSIRGRILQNEALVIFNGQIGSKGTISVVVDRRPSKTVVAVAADLASFKLADLIKTATGLDISGIPLIGSIVIPELKFAAATGDIKILLPELISTGSALEKYKEGINKGITGKFVIEIGGVSSVTVAYEKGKLLFNIPSGSSLSLKSLISSIPTAQIDILQSLPPQIRDVLNAEVTSFSFDPESKLLKVSGSLDKSIVIVPKFVTLTSISISLAAVLAPGKFGIDKLDLKGNWVLNKLPITTTVTYDKQENELNIVGELGGEDGNVNIRDFISQLSGKSLPIPSSIASQVKLSEVRGNKIGNTLFISLSGSIGPADIYLLYQKSEAGSAVGVAVQITKLRFASLVKSATGLDISSFPFFGTLVIPEIGFTIASKSIKNPLLATLYKPDSLLASFAQDISSGFTATFKFDMGSSMGYISDASSQVDLDSVKGLVADFTNKELKIDVPDSVELSLARVLKYIPGVSEVMDSLPQTLKDITNTRLHKLYYIPEDKKLQFSGSLKSLTLIPKVLSITDISFDMSSIIGEKPIVESLDIKGTWNLRTLSLETEVTYENKVLIIEAKPATKSGINVKDLIKGFTGKDLNIPAALNILEFTHVVGKIKEGTTSIVFLGQVKDVANVALVYQKSDKKKVIALAGDVKAFKLAELVKTGSNIDISSLPYFGDLTIPALSFILSSAEFSGTTLPVIESPNTPRELLLETIPKGLKGQFEMDMGEEAGVMDTSKLSGINADYSDNILTITAPPTASLSLATLLSLIPGVKSSIDSLPPTLKDILNAKITEIILNPATKNLKLSLELSTLTLVPKIVNLNDIKIHFDVDLVTKPNTQEMSSVETVYSEIESYAHGQQATELDEDASVEAITVNNFQMEATWVIRSLSIKTTITYDKETGKLLIKGEPSGDKGLSITDIINGFAKSNLKVPSMLSSLRITEVLADISHDWTTVIISARVGTTAQVYLIFDIEKSRKNVAVVAKIGQFRLAELIQSTTGKDVSKIPFIGKFKITDMDFSAATNIIHSSHYSSVLDSDSPLQEYEEAIPKGIQAHFKAMIDKIAIEVTYKDNELDFSIPSDVKLTLQALLAEIPSFEEKMKSLPPPINDLLACELEVFRYDQSTGSLSVVAHYSQIRIIPNMMTLKDLDIEIEAKLSAAVKELQSIEFKGVWVLRNLNINIKVSYDRDSGEISFSAISENGLSISSLITGLSGTTVPMPSSINSAKLMQIIGKKTKDQFSFIFTGTIAGKAHVHLIYQKYGKVSNIGVAVGIKSFKLAELLKSSVNVDITPIPFFGSFSVPTMAFTITKSELSVPLLSQVLSEDSPLTKYGTKLPKGFTAEFPFTVGKIKGVIGAYKNRIISFTVPDNVDVSLGALASQTGINVKSLNLPSVVGDILKIKLRNFSLNIPQKTLSLEVFINKMSFMNDRLTISKTTLKLKAKLIAPRSISAEIKGVVSLGDTDVNTYLRKIAGKYVVTLKTPVLSIFSLLKALGADMLPGDLQAVLGKIFNFKIYDLVVEYPFGVQPQQIMISGTPQLFGLKTMKMTAVVIKYGSRTKLISQYDLGKFNIADFIKKLLGISLHKIVFLDQDIPVSFILSPISVAPNTIKIPQFPIKTPSVGVTFSLPMGFPPNCNKDPFCAVCQNVIGKDAKLTLDASILSAKSFIMKASVSDIKLGGGVVMLKAGIEIEGGLNPSIGIAGYIKLRKPDVTIGAAIRATTSGVKLEGSLQGCIPKFLGSDYITICNMYLSLTLVPTPLPLTGFEFGVRIEIGKNSCGKKFIATGYVGINVINPNENYYYADINQLTFQTFFDAFCINVKLPRPLAESGFPEGLKASFSLLGKELPHARLSIPAGLYFKGVINILGLRANAHVEIKPYRTYVKITLPPINAAGLFKMYASRTDKSRGPYLIADISTKKRPYIEASGYADLLGISAEAKLLISTKNYELSLYGKFLNLFQAKLLVQASYGNIAKANFVVEGWFKSDLFDKIAAGVRNALKKSAAEADKHIKAAQEKIRQKKEEFNRADRKLVDAQRKVDGAKRSFDKAISKLESARRKVQSICKITTCSSGCIGCPKGWKCCAKAWGKCICKRPGWDSCCTRVPDPICSAKNLACRGLKKTADLAFKAAIAIVDKSRHVLDVAKAGLSIARGVVNLAKKSLDVAIAFLEGVRRTYNVGVKALSAVVNFVATKIINIREMYFKVGLNAASGGVFQCRVKGVLMGKNVNVNLKFDTKDIWSIIKSLGEKAIGGLSKFIG